MRLTNKSEYALLALAFLSRLKAGEYAHAEEISAQQEIPRRFLQQILYTLSRARIVRAVKGPHGGYALNRPAKTIYLAEVIRLFEGPLAATRSASKFFYASTPIEREKKILEIFQKLRLMAAQLLEKTSLADVN